MPPRHGINGERPKPRDGREARQSACHRWEPVGHAVPPFGRPILPFDLYLDETLLANDRIAASAGLLTDSIILAMPDYLRIAAPKERFAFSAPSQ